MTTAVNLWRCSNVFNVEDGTGRPITYPCGNSATVVIAGEGYCDECGSEAAGRGQGLITADDINRLVLRYNSFEEMIATIRAGTDRVIAQIEADRGRFERQWFPTLQYFAASKLPDGKKSLGDKEGLVAGVIGWRALPESFKVKSEAKARDWAKVHDPASVYEKPVEVVDKAALEEHFKATGELPDGCEYHPAKDWFFVRPPTERKKPAPVLEAGGAFVTGMVE